MRLALCQIDTTVGDFAGNTARILEGLARAEEARADLAVFPELAVCGYPPRDLLERPSFAREAALALRSLARRARRTALLVGTFVPNQNRVGKPFHNVSALLEGGRVKVLAKKTLLPTYDVFDEGRWFEPGNGCVVLPFRGERLGLPVCEDLWNDKDFWRQRRLYHDDPGQALVERGATLVVAISASPFSEGKPRLRRRMLARYARDGRVPVVSLNLVGGNDELVFDGDSMVVDARGRVTQRAAKFEEDFLVVDVAREGRGLARVVPSFREGRRPTSPTMPAAALSSRSGARSSSASAITLSSAAFRRRSSAFPGESIRRSSRPLPSRPSGRRT